MRGLSSIPTCLSAAWMRNSPSSGFSCRSRTRSIVRRSTLRIPSLRACDLSSNPQTPSSIQRRKRDVHGLAASVQIARNTPLVPALTMEPNDRQAAFGGILI